MKKYEEYLEKTIISKGLHTNITENRENITECEAFK
jgi:hypothetical protein